MSLIRREDAIKIAEKYSISKGTTIGKHSGIAEIIADEIADIPSVPAALLEPLAGFIVENLDPRVDCKTCATIREGWEGRECANCPKMSDEEVLDALKKWMEEQNAR